MVISNHILQGAPSQCGQGRHCGFHLDESETGWNGTSGEEDREVDPLSGGAKMSVLRWPSIKAG